MQDIVDFIANMSSGQKLAWIFICLSFNWIIEAISPLFKFDYQKLKHIGVNLVFLSTDLLINVLFTLATVGVFAWIGEHNIGLLNMIELPMWAELLIAVLALDLCAQYFAHYMLHTIPFMWRFHMIHHSDTHVDATSATRHHPGDYVCREIFALGAVFVFGIPLAFYLFYRILTVFFAYWSHANISMPKWIEVPISYVLVTPDMHKFHHHFERPWTDTNFGNIFSIWDRMFGTLTYDDPKKIQYGLDMLPSERSQDILYQYSVPFRSDVKTDPDKNWLGMQRKKK